MGYKEGLGFIYVYNDELIIFNLMEVYEGIRDVRYVMIDWIKMDIFLDLF